MVITVVPTRPPLRPARITTDFVALRGRKTSRSSDRCDLEMRRRGPIDRATQHQQIDVRGLRSQTGQGPAKRVADVQADGDERMAAVQRLMIALSIVAYLIVAVMIFVGWAQLAVVKEYIANQKRPGP